MIGKPIKFKLSENLWPFSTQKQFSQHLGSLLVKEASKLLEKTATVVVGDAKGRFSGNHGQRLSSDLSFSTILSMFLAEASEMNCYLAQFPVDHVPLCLRQLFPSQKKLEELFPNIRNSERFLWMNLAKRKVTSDWHYDSKPNYLIVLQGVKTVQMLEPREGFKLFGANQVGSLTPNFPSRQHRTVSEPLAL